MKYVMLQIERMPGVVQKIPVIFPEFLSHCDIAKAFSTVILAGQRKEAQIVSAGEICIDSCLCSGNSETLKIKSGDIDTWTIIRYDYFHGIE